MLNLVDQPTLLEIPAIHLSTAVEAMGWHRAVGVDGVAYSQWDDVRYAAGWHKNSAQPGDQGNVVLSGHNNRFGAVFRDIWRLEAGQVIYLSANGTRHAYVVERVNIEPERKATAAQQAQNAAFMRQYDDARLTLITCWPPNSNTHRVFVQARLADTEAHSTVR